MKRLIIALLFIPTIAAAQSTNVKIWDGTDIAGVTSGALDVNATLDTTGLATSAKQDTGNTSLASIDGKITAVNTGAVVISSSALPSGASTAAKQPALGTAGTASADVITVQGIASMTALKVDGSAVTQPVSGTVTVTDGAGALNAIIDSGTLTAVTAITNALPAGNNNIGDVDVASSVLPTGASTLAEQQTQTASLSVLDDWDESDRAKTNSILKPTTAGGLTTYHLVSAGSTNATNIKASAGQLYGWYIYNSNAAARKVAFHNTAGTPTAGASVYFSVMLPPGSAANVFSETGMAFSTGIAITTVTEIADSGNTAVAANDLIINLWYN